MTGEKFNRSNRRVFPPNFATPRLVSLSFARQFIPPPSPPVSRSRMFVYANTLHDRNIKPREREKREGEGRKGRKMGDCEEKSGRATGDTVHRAGDRAVSDIGNPPARGLPPETVRRRVNHAYERIEFPKKSRFYARQARFRYSPSQTLSTPRRYLLNG